MTDHSNPLLQDWQTPYQLPPFEQIRCEHFAPAFAALFEQHLAEINALVQHPLNRFNNYLAVNKAPGA
jgi:peptidyl-dipeptidase Dcp